MSACNLILLNFSAVFEDSTYGDLSLEDSGDWWFEFSLGVCTISWKWSLPDKTWRDMGTSEEEDPSASIYCTCICVSNNYKD